MTQLQKICSVIKNDAGHILLKFGQNVFIELSAEGVNITAPSVTFNCPDVIVNGNLQTKTGATGTAGNNSYITVKNGIVTGISE